MISQDDELLELLKDGDERVLPSNKMANQISTVVTQNLPSTEVTEGSTEEQLMIEVESNLRTLIDYGSNAVKDLADLASQSEHPRPYEALSTLIKSVTDANISMLSIRKKDRKIMAAAERFEKPEANDDNTISASVADLLDNFEQVRKTQIQNATDADFHELK